MPKVRAPSIVFRELIDRVRRGAGVTSPGERQAAFSGDDRAPWLEKVRRHAYQVTDADIATERERRSEDAIFELAVAAAIGVADRRRDTARAAIDAAEKK